MAQGTDCSPSTTALTGGCLDGSNVSAMEDRKGDTEGNLNQCGGKPPRDHSTLRYSTSSTWLGESVSIMQLPCFSVLWIKHRRFLLEFTCLLWLGLKLI